MIRVLTADEMRELDRRTSEEYGVPSILLMENAGRSVARVALRMLRLEGGALGPPKVQPSFWLHEAGSLSGAPFSDTSPRIDIVCGTGNNGGDGLVAARHLANWGFKPTVLLIGDKLKMKGDALANHDALKSRGLPVVRVTGPRHLQVLQESDLIIDAILGTGTRGKLSADVRDAINAINGSRAKVLAVDLPSGIEADSGLSPDLSVNADATVAMAALKPCHLLFPGARQSGRTVVVDIGIPSGLMGLDWTRGQFVVTPYHVAGLIPPRPVDSHKGVFGHAGIVAGSPGLTGAAEMAGLACSVAGAGLTTVVVPSELQPILATKMTECMTFGPEPGSSHFTAEHVRPVVEASTRWTAIAIGCGLGREPESAAFVKGIISSASCPMVIDADGLNALGADSAAVLAPHQGRIVITPHPGEMARLLGTDSAWVQSNRLSAARQAVEALRCVVVLKGAHTIIAEPEGRICYNVAQSVGLAKGGSGDILTGIIASLMAQGLSPFDAAVAGVWMHGRSAQIICETQAEQTLLASQVLAGLSDVYHELRENLPSEADTRTEVL